MHALRLKAREATFENLLLRPTAPLFRVVSRQESLGSDDADCLSSGENLHGSASGDDPCVESRDDSDCRSLRIYGASGNLCLGGFCPGSSDGLVWEPFGATAE